MIPRQIPTPMDEIRHAKELIIDDYNFGHSNAHLVMENLVLLQFLKFSNDWSAMFSTVGEFGSIFEVTYYTSKKLAVIEEYERKRTAQIHE